MDDFNLGSNLQEENLRPSSTSIDEVRERMQILRNRLLSMTGLSDLPSNQLSHAYACLSLCLSSIHSEKALTSQIQDLLNGLPRLTEQELSDLGYKGRRNIPTYHTQDLTNLLIDSSCPICITPYLSIIAEEEVSLAMDSPAHPVEELGVTKLSKPWQCGHIFCRRDIAKWITQAHDSCPMCRRLLVQPTSSRGVESEPVDDSDNSDDLVSLLEQLMNHANLLRSLNTLGSLPVLQAPNLGSHDRSDGEPNEERSQVSGMYS